MPGQIVLRDRRQRGERALQHVGVAERTGDVERLAELAAQAPFGMAAQRGREQSDYRAGAAERLAVLVNRFDGVLGGPAGDAPRHAENARERRHDPFPQGTPAREPELARGLPTRGLRIGLPRGIAG